MNRRPLPIPLFLLALCSPLVGCGGASLADPSEDTPEESTGDALTGGLVFTDKMESWRRMGDVDLDGREEFDLHVRATPSGVVYPSDQQAVVGVTSTGLYASWVARNDFAFEGRELGPMPVGDVTGDGRADFLHQDSVGWLLYSMIPGGGVVIHWRAARGSSVDGAVLGRADRVFAADLDANGRKELVVHTDTGLAFFRVDTAGRLSLYNTIAFGQRLAGDRLTYTSSCWTLGVGRFWGGSTDLVLVQCPAGTALLYVIDRAYMPGDAYAINFAPQDEMQVGGWRLGRHGTQGIGDFDGDGQADFVVQSPWGLGVLTAASWSEPTSFRTLGAIQWGVTAVDGAPLTVTGDGEVVVGDFDGDGRAELLIRDVTTQRLVNVVMDPTTRALVGRYTLRPGQLAGGWRYGGEYVFRSLVGRFGRGDRDSVVLRSAWGMGVIGVGPSGFMSYGASPFDVYTPTTPTTPTTPPPPPAPEKIWTTLDETPGSDPQVWTRTVASGLGSKKVTRIEILDAHPLSVSPYFRLGFVPRGHYTANCGIDAAVIWVDEGGSLTASQLAALTGSSPTPWSGIELRACGLSYYDDYAVPSSLSVAVTLVP